MWLKSEKGVRINTDHIVMVSPSPKGKCTLHFSDGRSLTLHDYTVDEFMNHLMSLQD